MTKHSLMTISIDRVKWALDSMKNLLLKEIFDCLATHSLITVALRDTKHFFLIIWLIYLMSFFLVMRNYYFTEVSTSAHQTRCVHLAKEPNLLLPEIDRFFLISVGLIRMNFKAQIRDLRKHVWKEIAKRYHNGLRIEKVYP